MGEPKQLLRYRGKTLIGHAISTALTLDDACIVVVLGAHAGKIRMELRSAPVVVAENPEWRKGMGGSVRTGLRALLDRQPESDAVIILLCDQPLVSAETLRGLIEANHRTGGAIVACDYGDTLGVPAFFTRGLFADLLALECAEGARKIFSAHGAEVITVPFPGGALDIDTPADYARLKKDAATNS